MPREAPEPVPFEKYCELSGAMAAWSKLGKDVGAMMNEKFRMSAAEFSNVSGYWMRRAMLDPSLLDRQQKLTQVYEELYSDSDSDPDPDADIVY